MGTALTLIGYLVVFIGSIWLLITAFQVSVGWGLVCLFIPFASIVFVIMYWEDAKKPFLKGAKRSGFTLISRLRNVGRGGTASGSVDMAVGGRKGQAGCAARAVSAFSAPSRACAYTVAFQSSASQ